MSKMSSNSEMRQSPTKPTKTLSMSVPPTEKKQTLIRAPSHFLVASDKLDKVTRRVIAPYAQIERRGVREDEGKESYLDMNKFKLFLEDTVDLDSLLYETALVLQTISNSSGVFVYVVDKVHNEIVLMPKHTKNPSRHEINIQIGEGKIAAAHAACTKEYLIIDDVERDTRFSEGLKWVDAKSAICMPIVKPDDDCYAVLELYRTYEKPYDNNIIYTLISVCCWAGAAVHQAQARVLLQKSSHINAQLVDLLQSYFTDRASFDTMITDMLAIIKAFIGTMRSSFYIVERCRITGLMWADMWDDGWVCSNQAMPKKRTKVNLSQEMSPVALVATTGTMLNIHDSYKDIRFNKEVDPTTGIVVRGSLVAPILDKNGVIGVAQVTNKQNSQPFNAEDEQIFNIFVNYCSLIVHFYNMQQRKLFHENMNKVYADLSKLHLNPCKHDFNELMEANGIILPPPNFKTFEFHISEGSPEDMPGLVVHMYIDTFAERHFDRGVISDFVLTVIDCYRDNPYHNAEHAFCFTHTMYLILVKNPGYFDFVETVALMLAGFCHDIDHPGLNNNFLSLVKHPLANMYKTSTLENHHYFLTKKIIEDKQLLSKLPPIDQERILEEIKYAILCTDLAVYFHIRAQITPLVAEDVFDWTDHSHKKMLKGILMTTSDLSGTCKPFGVAKMIAEKVYEEFYDQGDKEREMGYTPLSMMDRKRYINQPAEQIQFLSVVVLPCLMLLQNIFPNTSVLSENCRKVQDGWHEEIEIRGLKLWRQESSVAGVKSKFTPSIKIEE